MNFFGLFKTESFSRSHLHTLHENGIIFERALRRPSPTNSMTFGERLVVDCVRDLARLRGLSEDQIRSAEFAGQLDRETVIQPLRIKCKFQAWSVGQNGFSTVPTYVVTESNHPAIVVGRVFEKSEIEDLGVSVPKTPTLEKWQKLQLTMVRS